MTYHYLIPAQKLDPYRIVMVRETQQIETAPMKRALVTAASWVTAKPMD
jgi:hypothetical protein